MLRNHVTETYLQGFEPELSYLLWTDETNYNKQKEKAEQIVYNDLILRGLNVGELSPELLLRGSGNSIDATATETVYEDTQRNRLRLVVDNAILTVAGKTITLLGSNNLTDSSIWETVTIIELSTSAATGGTSLFYKSFKHYKISVTVLNGEIDYRAYLVETKYDLLFAYKWLELILRNAKTDDGDQFDLKAKEYKSDYHDLLNSGKYEIDTNNDGVPDVIQSTNILTILR